MRIGQEEIDLAFGQCGNIIFEPTAIRREMGVNIADGSVDPLQPLREECHGQRMQGGKLQRWVLPLPVWLKTFARGVKLPDRVLGDGEKRFPSRVSCAGKVARLTSVTPARLQAA